MEGSEPKPWGYARCYFGDNSAKLYDYIAPFPVQPGDKVKVASSRGPGWTKVTVAEIVETPDSAKMPILEIIPPEPAETEQEA